MVRASVTADPVFRVTGTTTMFSGASRLRTYALGPDQPRLPGGASPRFLGIGLAAPQPAGSEIHLVVNWFRALEQILPAD